MASAFEARYGVEGAAALVDTDFMSDSLLYHEEDLSEGSHTRWQKQNVGKGSREVRGLKWRSLDVSQFLVLVKLKTHHILSQFIAFLHILDAMQKQGDHSISLTAQAEDDTQPPPAKRRKTMKPKEKNMFNAHPSKMTDRIPNSQKSLPSKPYKPMCNPAWLQAHLSVDVVEGMPWLQGLYEKAKDGSLTAEDRDYLAELAAHLADSEASELAHIPVDVTVPDTTTCTTWYSMSEVCFNKWSVVIMLYESLQTIPWLLWWN